MNDMYIYSIENIRKQIQDMEPELGFYSIRLYSENGRPVRTVSDTVEEYYYYPSGGTIRDRHMNILFYEPKLDQYHRSTR